MTLVSSRDVNTHPGNLNPGTKIKFTRTRSGLHLKLLVRPSSAKHGVCAHRPSVVCQMCVAWWVIKLHSLTGDVFLSAVSTAHTHVLRDGA